MEIKQLRIRRQHFAEALEDPAYSDFAIVRKEALQELIDRHDAQAAMIHHLQHPEQSIDLDDLILKLGLDPIN